MANGIAKGVGEQFGELGKQIVREAATLPAKIAGMDAITTNETTGTGTGGKKQTNTQQQQAADQAKIAEIKQQDEVEKQKQLALARQLLQQFTQAPQKEPSLREKMEMEKMEKKKKEIQEEKKKANMQLSQVASKPKRGNLYGIKQKQFAGELGKNAKAQ